MLSQHRDNVPIKVCQPPTPPSRTTPLWALQLLEAISWDVPTGVACALSEWHRKLKQGREGVGGRELGSEEESPGVWPASRELELTPCGLLGRWLNPLKSPFPWL